ncbi:MAG: GIY-YIG nuclease family protein [bacterium]
MREPRDEQSEFCGAIYPPAKPYYLRYNKQQCIIFTFLRALIVKLYIGFTANIRLRFGEHITGTGGKITQKQTDREIIYLEGYLIKKDDLGREKFLKGDSRGKYLQKQLTHDWNHKK